MATTKRAIMIIAVFFMAGCDKHAANGNPATLHSKNAHPRKMAANTAPLLPSMRPAKGVLQHTVYVGTIDHPTIDGGIINAADGIPVNHGMPFTVNPVSLKVKTNAVKSPLNQPTDAAGPFQDNWATSQKVKKVLEEAARNGKLGYVLNKTNQMQLPASVATVPMVESHYQDNVISPKGAAGAWQLMPAAANDYGMQKNQRFEFEKSTDAALALLNNLHQEFGSWELAFAAYNAGAARVRTALKKTPGAVSIEQLDLPIETKNYVNHIMSLNKALMGY